MGLWFLQGEIGFKDSIWKSGWFCSSCDGQNAEFGKTEILRTGAGNIYVSNLDPNIDNKVRNWCLVKTRFRSSLVQLWKNTSPSMVAIKCQALYDTFSLFGNILSCKVASDTSGKPSTQQFEIQFAMEFEL